MPDILHGLVEQMAQETLMARHRTEKSSLQWHYFLPLIAGATGKGFLLIAKRQKSCCIPVFIKEKTEKRDVPCGIRITT